MKLRDFDGGTASQAEVRAFMNDPIIRVLLNWITSEVLD